MPKYLKYKGERFKVLKYNPFDNEVQVEVELDYAEKPYKRRVACWWSLDDCELGNTED